MKLGKREVQKNSCHLDDLGNLVRSKSLIIIIVLVSYVLITCKWKNASLVVINVCVIAKIAMNDTNYVWMCMGQNILSCWILFANVSNCLLELLTTWAIIFIWEKVLDENVKVLTSFLFFHLVHFCNFTSIYLIHIHLEI